MLHCMASTPSSSDFTVLERQRAWLKWQQQQQQQQQQEWYFYSADHALQCVAKLDGLNGDGLNGGWPNQSTSDYQILSNDPAPIVKDEPPTRPFERARSASKKRKADKSPSSILDGNNAAEECIKEERTKESVEENKTAAAKTDYIHVRARRGQATDSHSLAERVRREKISERMRYLQDLVPGCNKITSKAGMLDEIINYVQSLQRQVEFLSMKLAAVNPTLDFSADDSFSKGINAMTPSMVIPETGMASELIDPSCFPLNTLQQDTNSSGALGLAVSSPDAVLRRAVSAPGSTPQTFLDSCFDIYGGSNISTLSDLELQQGKGSALLFQLLQGNFLPNHHIKMEM